MGENDAVFFELESCQAVYDQCSLLLFFSLVGIQESVSLSRAKVFFGHWAVSMGCPSIMDLPQTIQFWALQTDDLIADMNLEIDPALLYGVHEDKVGIKTLDTSRIAI